MSKIAKMAIKWPKLKNDYFLLKKQFYHLSIILYQLSFINIYNSRPRNIENSITSDESMKIMILSKMAQKWSKWPTEAFINHRLGQIGDIESLKRFWKRQVFSQWFGVESPLCALPLEPVLLAEIRRGGVEQMFLFVEMAQK